MIRTCRKLFVYCCEVGEFGGKGSGEERRRRERVKEKL
jgi:hypothetical protein